MRRFYFISARIDSAYLRAKSEKYRYFSRMCGACPVQQFRIYDFHSPDVENLYTYIPPNEESLYFLLEFSLEYNDCSFLFSAVVASLEAVRKRGIRIRQDKTKYLIVRHYAWTELEERIHRITAESLFGSHDISPLLRFFNWEYE